jgi:hypothetical protein
MNLYQCHSPGPNRVSVRVYARVLLGFRSPVVTIFTTRFCIRQLYSSSAQCTEAIIKNVAYFLKQI